ncbi:MAG: LysR family transcriptional regulator [Pseudomonadota bacterium]
MRTQPFQTLRRILDVGSFSQAAQLENMTLSALSMQMKALEAELGVTLFDRQARPPRLTPLGRAIAETSSAFSAAEAQIRALCAAERGLAGRFTVGFIPTAGVRIMPPFLANVARAAPQAVLTTASGLSEELSQRVADGRLDAAVVTGVPELPANLAAHGLGRERMLGIGPTGSGLNMLQELDFLHFQPASGIGRLITTILRQSDIAPPRTIIIPPMTPPRNDAKTLNFLSLRPTRPLRGQRLDTNGGHASTPR